MGSAIPETMRALQDSVGEAHGRPRVPGPVHEPDHQRALRGHPAPDEAVRRVLRSRHCRGALGLLGLAVFTAQRRTREIGLRKVMGASRSDILRFISWQFARPVLLANLIAWPLAWFFMRRWLEGFAYHVDVGVLSLLAGARSRWSLRWLPSSGMR